MANPNSPVAISLNDCSNNKNGAVNRRAVLSWVGAASLAAALSLAAYLLGIICPYWTHGACLTCERQSIVAPIAGNLHYSSGGWEIINAQLEAQLDFELKRLQLESQSAEDELKRVTQEKAALERSLTAVRSESKTYLKHWRKYLEHSRDEIRAQHNSANILRDLALRQAARGSKLEATRSISAIEFERLIAESDAATQSSAQFFAEVKKFDDLIVAIDDGHVVDMGSPLYDSLIPPLALRIETLTSSQIPFLEQQSIARKQAARDLERTLTIRCRHSVGFPTSFARKLVHPGKFVAMGEPLYEEPMGPAKLVAVMNESQVPAKGEIVQVNLESESLSARARVVELRSPTREASYDLFHHQELRQDQVLVIATLIGSPEQVQRFKPLLGTVVSVRPVYDVPSLQWLALLAVLLLAGRFVVVWCKSQPAATEQLVDNDQAVDADQEVTDSLQRAYPR